MAAVRAIGILAAQTTVGGVFVDHRVHATGGNAKEETGTAQLAEIAEVAVPVGLGHDGHAPPSMLYHTADDGSAERGVVDIGIAREQDAIEVIPSTQLHFFLRRGKPVAQTMLGH